MQQISIQAQTLPRAPNVQNHPHCGGALKGEFTVKDNNDSFVGTWWAEEGLGHVNRSANIDGSNNMASVKLVGKATIHHMEMI